MPFCPFSDFDGLLLNFDGELENLDGELLNLLAELLNLLGELENFEGDSANGSSDSSAVITVRSARTGIGAVMNNAVNKKMIGSLFIYDTSSVANSTSKY